MPRFGVILAAAGQSSRFQDANYKKPFAPLAGRPVWLHSAEKFIDRDDVKQVVIVVSPDDRQMFVDKFGANLAAIDEIHRLRVEEATRKVSCRGGLPTKPAQPGLDPADGGPLRRRRDRRPRG